MNKTGYIYSLTCNNSKLIYYGSTTRPLNERLSKHKYDFKNNNCVSSKILFEWGNVKINMIEEIDYKNKIELREREAYYIRNLKCVNKFIPNRTTKGYYYDNKEKLLNKCKEYQKNNKDKKKLYDKEYNKINKDKKKQKFICGCGSNIIKADITRHKKTNKHKVYEFLKEIEESNIII